MILTRHNTLIYLVNLGILTVQDITGRAIEVRSHAQRNRGFSVTWRSERQRSTGVYVKQHWPDEGYWSTGSTVQSEAALLQYFAGKPELFGLVPTCRVFDRPNQIAVIGWLTETGPLADQILEESGDLRPTTELLGKRLKELHAALSGLPEEPDRPSLNGEPPWAVLFKRLLPVISEDQNPAQAEMVGLIQQQEDLMAGLAAIAGDWASDQIIHGDMKWQNCLMIRQSVDEPSSTETDPREIVFIDWEMAALGEPLWDLAGLSQSYIKAWLDGFDLARAETGEAELANAVAAAFPRCQEQLAMLWQAYVGAESTGPAADRFSRLTGARLIQTVYEETSGEAQVQLLHMVLLQLARNLIIGPEQGGGHLLLAS